VQFPCQLVEVAFAQVLVVLHRQLDD
jgi:hypothetical protein